MNNWASALKSTYTPPPENSLLAQIGDMATFMDWYCKKQGISELTQKDLEGPAYEIIKVFHPDVVHLQFQMEECHKLLTDQVDDAILRYNVSKPLPLGGDPGHVTIQLDFFFNKDLEYLQYGRKIVRPALSISKMKAAYYPDVGLEQMVPDQMWIEEECKYDVAAMYGISHWWFQRQRFYIDRHTSEGDRRAVRTHMRILSVVRIEVFPMYGYNYMKKIVLRRADLKEYVIAERDFKYLYPSDFEDLYLLNLQGHLNHLSPKDKKILTTAVNLWTRNLVIRQRVEDFQLGIKSYQTQLNLTKPRWDAKGFEYKHKLNSFELSKGRHIDEAVRLTVKGIWVKRRKIWVWIRFGRRKTSTQARSLCLPYRNNLKEDVSSRIWKDCRGRIDDTLAQPSLATPRSSRTLVSFSQKINTFLSSPTHSELVDIEKVAVRSSLRLPKTKNALMSLRIYHVDLARISECTKVFTVQMEILLEPMSKQAASTSLIHFYRSISSNTISKVACFEVSGKEILARLHKDGDADASFQRVVSMREGKGIAGLEGLDLEEDSP
ncbi:hypothetical protein Tco_0772008 [Tanacetum coccineum]|uniref:Uncharacterized protein n=1 Tax=Tanacetum coccineum TaxID=301880 RepID=A0ABQ4ZHS7_9ASTR